MNRVYLDILNASWEAWLDLLLKNVQDLFGIYFDEFQKHMKEKNEKTVRVEPVRKVVQRKAKPLTEIEEILVENRPGGRIRPGRLIVPCPWLVTTDYGLLRILRIG